MIIKKVFLCLLLILGVPFIGYSQTVSIKDKQTGEPLDFVTLISEKPNTFLTTNAAGQADVTAFTGAEKIEIRRLGYQTEVFSFAELEKMNFEVLLSFSFTQFDEIVVSATRWRQPSRNVLSRISVITPTDVALYNPQTAADLLGSTGEVFIQKSQQGGGSPMIRGFAANRLLYTVDGVRMNTAIFRAGNIQNVISLDPFAIESSEVFFGPGSIIYGSDAIGGVMSFQMLNPQLSWTDKPLIKGKAVSRYSSANSEITNHFDVNTGWKKWASVTSLSHSKYGNLRMGEKGPEEYLKRFYVLRIDSLDSIFENSDPRVQNPSGYSQMNLMQKVRFRPNNNWDFQFGVHYSETSDYSRYDRLVETDRTGSPVYAVWNYGPQIWMMHNFLVSHQNTSRIYDKITLRVAQQYFEESRTDRRFNHHRLRTQLEAVHAYSANLDFEKDNQKHRYGYGAEYIFNDVKSTGSAVDIRNGKLMLVPDRYPASEWRSCAAYLNYQYLASIKFLFQAGVRYSAINIQSDFRRHLTFYPFDFTTSSLQNSAITGSFGVIFRPGESWKISANASTGFRAPNVDDIGKIFDFAVGEVVVPNTSLKSEYAYHGEIGINKIFGDGVKFDATGFYTFLDQAMVRRPFQVNRQDSIPYNGIMSKVYAIQNAASAMVYGFNAGIELKFPSGFGLSSRFNYQLGNEEMDNGEKSRSRHAAPAFGNTRLFYQKNKLHLQFHVIYCAEVSYKNLNIEERQKPSIYAKDANGKPYSPGWYTLNFEAMYQFHQFLSISSGVENITDKRYRPYSSGLVAPERNFIISLRAVF